MKFVASYKTCPSAYALCCALDTRQNVLGSLIIGPQVVSSLRRHAVIVVCDAN